MLEVGESWSRAKLGSVVTVAGFHTITREAFVAEEHAPRLDWRMHFTEPRGGVSSPVADAGQNIVKMRRGGGN